MRFLGSESCSYSQVTKVPSNHAAQRKRYRTAIPG